MTPSEFWRLVVAGLPQVTAVAGVACLVVAPTALWALLGDESSRKFRRVVFACVEVVTFVACVIYLAATVGESQ